MTMMIHIRRIVEISQTSKTFEGRVYFRGIEKRFDGLALSEDEEVLLVSSQEGPLTAIRIASIDAIELPPLDAPADDRAA